MIFQILEDWKEIKSKKTFDDTHLRIKKVFIKNNFNTVSSKHILVKNIGNCSKKRVLNALRYVIENSDDKAVNENGREVSLKEILDDWRPDFSDKKNSKEGWHLVFSINEEINAKNMKTLERAVKDTMEKNFFLYKYVMVKHTHQNNPHIHVIVNKNNIFTKRKMHFQTKEDCREFFNTIKDDFAMALNFYDSKLKYVNLYKHDRDLELQKMQEQKLENLELKLDLDKRIKELEVQSIINANKIEKNTKRIKEISLEQRKLFYGKNFNIKEIEKNQGEIELLQKKNEKLRDKNKEITNFIREFKKQKEQDISLPFSKEKSIDFLKKNPKLLTLKQILTLAKLEKINKQEKVEIQGFQKDKNIQNIKHNQTLGTFQKTTKILNNIQDCRDNLLLFPEQKEVFQKNIAILEKQLHQKAEILDEKIMDFQKTVNYKEIVEKENIKIEKYFEDKGIKRERNTSLFNNAASLYRNLGDIFKDLQTAQKNSNISEVKKLESILSQRFDKNLDKIFILKKSLLSKAYLAKEKKQIENYFKTQKAFQPKQVDQSLER